MREFVWLLAVAGDIVHGYPAREFPYPRRELLSSGTGFATNQSFPTASGTSGLLPGGTVSTSTSTSNPFDTSPNTFTTTASPTTSIANGSTTFDPLSGFSSVGSSGTQPSQAVGTGIFSTKSTGTGASSGGGGIIGPTTGHSSSLNTSISRTSVISLSATGASSNGLSIAKPTGTGVSSEAHSAIGPTGVRSSGLSTSGSGTGIIGPSSTGASGTGNNTSGVQTGTSSISPSSTKVSSTGTITSLSSLSTVDISSLSTQVTSIAGVTVNTELTTTDDKGHSTVVPFLFGCWFCGGSGLLLWGVGPGPGVYPPPTPPPFPSWPTITIGNDNVPTPDPSSNRPTDTPLTTDSPTSTSPTTTKTRSSSSSSCTGSTVTDYWVSCASAVSGTTSSCSTYSSSIATGCSLTAATNTTISSCTAPASVDSDDLQPGEIAGPEYDYLDPKATQVGFPWTYTVAVIASSGIVGATPGPAPSSGPTNTANSTSVASTTNESGTSSAPTSTSVLSLCQAFQDPDNGDEGHCQCSSGSLTTTLPFSTSSGTAGSGPCHYTSLPSPRVSSAPTTTSDNPLPFTTTDPSSNVIACASSSLLAVATFKFTYCDGSSTTISTGTPTSSSKPSSTLSPNSSPTADCALWDAGFYWNFEVYNIQGWATDEGGSLHKEEKGCGALTGWSWSDEDSGGQARFNLPFFIKGGCVERAIASAGGPKLSCKHEGVAERSVDVPTLESRADVASPGGTPPDLSNATVAAAYNPPGTNFDDVSHSYSSAVWDNARRSLTESSILLERKELLSKRGCGFSKPKDPGSPAGPTQLFCNPIIPGVDECNDQIRAHGNVGRKVSIFYTGWGATGAANVGGAQARKWVRQNLCDVETVSWVGICDGDWKIGVQDGIKNAFVRPGMSSDELDALNEKYDPFLKNLAQSFAETSKGDAYVFIPQGRLANNQWDMSSAWGGWEYPALTKNKEVKRILRVDLDVSDADHPRGTPQMIFDRDQGDSEANYEPKGARGPSLPVGLPADQVPDNWNQPGSL